MTSWTKSQDEVEGIREAGRVVAVVLCVLAEAIEVGVTTRALERLACDTMAKMGAKSSVLGYTPHPDFVPFPAAICTSTDHQIVHGVPDERPLQQGQLVTVDVAVSKDGWHADGATTLRVGRVSSKASRLLTACQLAMVAGIKRCRRGQRVGDVGFAIERVLRCRGFSVLRGLSGHGIGREMHEPPRLPSYGAPRTGHFIRPGMTLAVEAMSASGTAQYDFEDNGWTLGTRDGSPAVHFEHTILVTDRAPVILTLP